MISGAQEAQCGAISACIQRALPDPRAAQITADFTEPAGNQPEKDAML